jgi:hypothetical protein
MQKPLSAITRLAAASWLLGTLASANAAPPSPEDHYIAARDAAIAKITKFYDSGKADDAAKAEKAVSADLLTQMKAIVAEPDRKGFGPARLNLDAFSKGDQGFGMLDGLRYDSLIGDNGEKAGANGADSQYVEPKSHVIVTTQPMFECWLRAHKEWWGKKPRNVPQQIGAALKAQALLATAMGQ